MNSKLTPELAALAAELALGILEGEELAAALRHTIVNPEFSAEVQEWRERLDPLGEGFADALPPDSWGAINARLDAEAAANAIGRLRFWRGAAMVAGVAAAGLAGIILFGPTVMMNDAARSVPQQATAVLPVAVAQLAGTKETLLVARIGPEPEYLDIRAIDLPKTPLAPELWVIPSDGVPRSLGLITPDGTTKVRLPESLQPFVVDGSVLAVSLEEAEGAPHAAPSRAPIATGRISSI